MPREDVDRAALAEVIEAVFETDLPASCDEPPDDHLDDRGVVSVKETVELTATPSELEAKVDVESGAHLLERRQRHVCQPPELHLRDPPLADAGTTSYVSLSQTELLPNRPNDPARTSRIHRGSFVMATYVALCRR